MSVFNKVIQKHREQREVRAAAESAEGARASEERTAFAASFAEVVAKVAKPLFEEFARDAVAAGFPAVVEDRVDGYGNPLVAIRLVPEEGGRLGIDSANESVYQLRALLNDQKIEHALYIDQRHGRHGERKATHDVQSLTKAVIERELEEFLDSALTARVIR